MTTALLILAGLLAFDLLFVAVLWTLSTLRRRHLRRHPPRPLLDFTDATFDWWHEDARPSKGARPRPRVSANGNDHDAPPVAQAGSLRRPYDREAA